MTFADFLEEIYDWFYYKFRFSKIGQYAMLAYNMTFDDVLLIPRKSLHSRSSACVKTKLTKNISLDIPIASSNMDTVTGVDMAVAMAELGGIGFIYRLTCSIEEEAEMVKEVKRRGLKKNKTYMVGASVGIKEDFMERAKQLIEAGTDIIVFDVANGYSKQMAFAIKTFKSKYPYIPIVAGNVATPGGIEFLAKLGVDCIKVGIGPGSVCTTRIVTGHGIPLLSSIYRCAKKAKKYGIPIISDGGIRNSGDIVKALAVGANIVMIGSLLAGTFESTGKVYCMHNNKPKEIPRDKIKKLKPEEYHNYFKIYRGMSGKDVQIDAQKKSLSQRTHIVPEGVTKKIPYTGPMTNIIEQLIGGLRSGMSYSYSKTIPELQRKAIFEKVSPVGLKENTAHAEEFKY